MIVAGNDDLCVEGEVGDRSDVGSDQVLVLTAGHRLAVIRQVVLHVVHEIIEASFVQSVKVQAVTGPKIGARHVSTSCGFRGALGPPPPSHDHHRACSCYVVDQWRHAMAGRQTSASFWMTLPSVVAPGLRRSMAVLGHASLVAWAPSRVR